MHQAIMEKIAAVPGVTSVAMASTVTMSGQGWHDPLFAQDKTYDESKIPPLRLFKMVTPGYVKTLGAALVAGRDFTWTDAYELRPVAMVSENLARELWGEPSAAVGKWIRPYTTGSWREVVGVVSDTRDDGLHQKAPTVAYWPVMMQDFVPAPKGEPPFVARNLSYLVRSGRTGSGGFVNELQRAIWSVNPNLPLAGVRTLQEIYDASLARTSFTLVMLGIAGGMALLLGVAGIYGVISYSVSQRSREIGIRIALGAQRRQVITWIMRRGLYAACAGLAAGALIAWQAAPVLSAFLYGVGPADALTFGVVIAVLGSVAVAASFLPARRVSRVDPAVALKDQ
jgi:predicted permease